MRTTLFRKEALKQKQNRLWGDIIIQKPLSLTFLSILTAAIVVIVLAFLIWGQYSRKQTVSGYLVPNAGLIEVYAPSNGVIVEKDVKNGITVKSGQTLFVVSTKQSTLNVPDVGSALVKDSLETAQALEEQITKTRELGSVQQQQLSSQIQGLKNDIADTQKELITAKARYTIEENEYGKLRILKSQGMISDSQYQAQYGQVLQQQANVESLQKTLTDLRQQLHDAQLNLLALPLKTASQIATYQQELAQQNQQNAELQAKQNFVVQAPAAGVVTDVLYDPGQAVNPNMPLLAILPTGSSLEAKLFVPTGAIGFVKEGQHVRLRYEAFPYQHFGLYQGTVSEISKSVLLPNQLSVPIRLTGPVYPVTVQLAEQDVNAYGSRMPLEAGMQLQADILTGRQRLIRWIFGASR